MAVTRALPHAPAAVASLILNTHLGTCTFVACRQVRTDCGWDRWVGFSEEDSSPQVRTE